jgi:hypothetical protein
MIKAIKSFFRHAGRAHYAVPANVIDLRVQLACKLNTVTGRIGLPSIPGLRTLLEAQRQHSARQRWGQVG